MAYFIINRLQLNFNRNFLSMNEQSDNNQSSRESIEDTVDKEDEESFHDLWERIKDTQLSKLDETVELLEDEKILLDDNRMEDVYTWKIVLIGEGAVGKTTLRRSFFGENFTGEYLQTIGADFATKEDTIGSKNKVKFVIWDLAGQPRFKNIRKVFYTGAQGAIFVCDLTNQDSFNNITQWISELWNNNNFGPIPFIVVGNKVDLREEGVLTISDKIINEFTIKTSQETLKRYGFGIKSIITSAKTGYNVNKAFRSLAIQLIAHERHLAKQPKQSERPRVSTKDAVLKIDSPLEK